MTLQVVLRRRDIKKLNTNSYTRTCMGSKACRVRIQRLACT